jgi:hypothetical protein
LLPRRFDERKEVPTVSWNSRNCWRAEAELGSMHQRRKADAGNVLSRTEHHERSWRSSIVALSVSLLGVGPHSAQAQTSVSQTASAKATRAAAAAAHKLELPDPRSPLGDALTGEAKEAYDQANALLERNELSGAFTLYHRAYELSHDGRLLWNMGRVEYLRKRYAAARTWVERFFAEGRSDYVDTDPEADAKVRNWLRTVTGEVALDGVPDGAKIYLDGRHVATAPLGRPLYVEPGVRSLRVALPDQSYFTQELVLTASEQSKVNVRSLPIRINKANATLEVATNEPQSSIQIDHRVVGRGSWRGVLPVGKHDVDVMMTGKQTFHEQVMLPAGGSRTLSVKLNDEDKALVWPWVVGGVAVAAGLAVGGYFLLRPQEETRAATLSSSFGGDRP